MPELDDLETLLEGKLAVDPLALSLDDAEIDSALVAVMGAYISAYPPLVEGEASDVSNAIAVGPSEPVVMIDPSYAVSGHEISCLGADRFRVTNSRGRWAYCRTPQEDFYLFPNGSLVDLLRNRLWAR